MIIHEVIVKEKLNKIAQSLGIIYKVLASLMSAALSYLVFEMKLKTPNCGRICRGQVLLVKTKKIIQTLIVYNACGWNRGFDRLGGNLSDVRLPHTPLHRR